MFLSISVSVSITLLFSLSPSFPVAHLPFLDLFLCLLLPLSTISLNLLLLSVLQEIFCTYKYMDELGFNFMERDYRVIFLQIFFLYGLIIKKCMHQYLDELRIFVVELN